jgi:hypothetical protein
MIKRLLKNRAGTAEIVGTVLFLVILFFFFSNVFLWHDQVTREIDQIVSDKMNSPVRLETAAMAQESVHGQNYPIIKETEVSEHDYELQWTCQMGTGIDTPQKMRLVDSIRLSINVEWRDYMDGETEDCYVYIRDFKSAEWFDTGLRAGRGFRWLNVTLPQANRYFGSGGTVQILFTDSSSILHKEDDAGGELQVSYIEVTPEVVVLEVSDLGGVDISLSRLWIVNSTQHIRVDFESVVVPSGSHQYIVFNEQLPNCQGTVINYDPQAGETVIFKVLTTLGNTAACSHDFPSD